MLAEFKGQSKTGFNLQGDVSGIVDALVLLHV